MSAVEAASVGVKTMADGTLRLTVDIEPRHAQDAFRLFGSPGTPIALAALKTGQAAQTDEGQGGSSQEPAERPKGGELSVWCGIRCSDREFWAFLRDEYGYGIGATEEAAGIVRSLCGVESRADIDNDEQAKRRFHERIRGPWQKWCIARGVHA